MNKITAFGLREVNKLLNFKAYLFLFLFLPIYLILVLLISFFGVTFCSAFFFLLLLSFFITSLQFDHADKDLDHEIWIDRYTIWNKLTWYLKHLACFSNLIRSISSLVIYFIIIREKYCGFQPLTVFPSIMLFHIFVTREIRTSTFFFTFFFFFPRFVFGADEAFMASSA